MITITDNISKEDLESLYCIESCITYGWTKDMLRNTFEKESSFFLKAVECDKVVGYANYSIIIDEAELNSVSVLQNYRKMGVASKILQALLQKLKDKNVRAVFLEVNENNVPAIGLYEKFGFEKISERKNYYKKETALIYKKTL